MHGDWTDWKPFPDPTKHPGIEETKAVAKIEVIELTAKMTAQDPVPHYVAVLDYGFGKEVKLELPAVMMGGDITGHAWEQALDAMEKVAAALLDFVQSQRGK